MIISFEDADGYQPLQHDHFESLYRGIHDEPTPFDLDRLPADANPYPAVLSVHPRYEVDAEDIYEVLVGACADGTSVSTLCENSEDSLRG